MNGCGFVSENESDGDFSFCLDLIYDAFVFCENFLNVYVVAMNRNCDLTTMTFWNLTTTMLTMIDVC
jgi:hypothetical protein